MTASAQQTRSVVMGFGGRKNGTAPGMAHQLWFAGLAAGQNPKVRTGVVDSALRAMLWCLWFWGTEGWGQKYGLNSLPTVHPKRVNGLCAQCKIEENTGLVAVSQRLSTANYIGD